MKYSTFLGLLLITAAACGDDSEAAKGVFVPNDAANAQTDAGNAEVNSTTDAGTDTSVDPLACEFTDKACLLTCEVLLDPSFCWNIARAEANACGQSTTRGVMSADGLTCTSPTTVVRFDAPVKFAEVPDREVWAIEISRSGNICLELEDGPLSLSLATASGKVDVSLSREPELYRIECPNGSAWESNDSLALLACNDAEGLTSLPGISTTTVGDDFQFGLLPGPDSLLWCGF